VISTDYTLKEDDMATSEVTTNLLRKVERLQPLIREHAARNEANRRLSSEVYDAMYEAGLFGMLAPRAFGGLEVHPVDAMRVWEAVGRCDSAAGWNLSMHQTLAGITAWLPAAGAREVFREGIATMAGAFNPPAAATRVEGGWRLSGQFPFASGCHRARWLLVAALEMEGGQPKVDPATGQPAPFAAVVPRTAATILDTWHTMGMRGTGSTDFTLQDLFVPEHMTAPVAPLTNPGPGFEGPLYRLWPWTNILGEATESVAVAAEAIDAGVQLCKTKTPAFNTTPVREQQLAQFQMGKARSRVEAARDTLYRAAEQANDELAGTTALLSDEAKIRLQLAVCFAAEACAEAVRWVNDATGTSSFRESYPFERHFRDAHVLVQHAFKSSARYASAGRLMFGQPNDWLALMF
jgi:alkylation response protein AidB-like acyl-CoA dehydrogenase